MRSDAVLRLFDLHLYRALKPAWKLGLAVGGVVMLPVVLGDGMNPDMTVGFVAVFLLYLPANLALNMTQEKIEGSLRFLASLPVTGREHAASRLLAVAALTMPLVTWLSVALPLFRLQTIPEAVLAGIGFGVGIFLVSLVVIAFQYKYTGQKARSAFVYVLVAFVAVVWMSTRFEGWVAVLANPAVIVGGSVVGGIVVVAVGRYALRTIIEYAPVYDREKDEVKT